MYTQDFNPVSDSLGLTAIFAVLPILTLFVLLGGLKLKAQWAALIALAVAMAVAMIVYGMPVDQTGLSALEGATFGLFPIMWIVVAAIWVYNMTVETGHFAVLRRSFGAISEDQRIQAVIIAFCFGALLEALAGFGTPVAITAVMMIALGFRPIKAASIALVANTAPVAFGAIAIPITTLSEITGPRQGRPRRNGRSPDAVPRPDRAADPDRHGRRAARHPPGVAGGRRRRPHLRARPVRLLELHLGRADRHRRVAAEHRRDRAFLRVWTPGEPLLAEDTAPTGRFQRPAAAGASVHDPVMEKEVARRDDTTARLQARRAARLRAVPDHHRGVLDRPDTGGQEQARRVALDHHVPVAGARRAHA